MPPEDPLPSTTTMTTFANCLEKELYQYLSKYNYRGDRLRLVEAIVAVVGDERQLADVAMATAIPSNTLATYVRIGRLNIRAATLEQYQREKKSSALNVKVGDETKPSTSKRPSESNKTPVKSSPMKSPAAAKERRVEGLAALFARNDGDDEPRLRACVGYVVQQQYRRGQPAQQALCDALEDVLLNGLAVAEACQMHTGVSEHVLSELDDCIDSHSLQMSTWPACAPAAPILARHCTRCTRSASRRWPRPAA